MSRLESAPLPASSPYSLGHLDPDFIAGELADGMINGTGLFWDTGQPKQAAPGSWISSAFGMSTAWIWGPKTMWVRYLDGYVLRRVA